MARAVVCVSLRNEEVAALRRPVIGTGGMQDLLRRFQSRLRADTLEIYVDDLPRIASYWRMGRGGFQARFPMQSVAHLLPSVAPLFTTEAPTPGPWIYFVTEENCGDITKIKIGQTANPRRRSGGLRTDNPRPFRLLLLLPPAPGIDDHFYHRRFTQLRIRDTQEWFWPGDDLLTFIRDEAAKQKRSA